MARFLLSMKPDWAEKAVEEIMQPEKDWPEKAADEILRAMFGPFPDDAHVSGSVGYHERLVIQRMMEIIRRHANEARPHLGEGRLITRKTITSLWSPEELKARLQKAGVELNGPQFIGLSDVYTFRMLCRFFVRDCWRLVRQKVGKK